MLRQPPAHQRVTERISESVLRRGGLKRKLRARRLPQIGGMTAVIALAAIALMGVFLGSVWLRRDELEVTGESRSMMVGLVFCVVSVVLILLAAATLGS
jgi:hypothetical protein